VQTPRGVNERVSGGALLATPTPGQGGWMNVTPKVA